MKVQELLKDNLLEEILSEDTTVSSELKDLIRAHLETPLDATTSEINKTISAASVKLKTWAMDQIRTVKITDDRHQALLTKIINHPEQVARELAMNILKRKFA